MVVAVQEKIDKKENQIGINDLITLFKNRKLISENMADEILELNDIRNTFHLTKPRTKKCDIKQMESALKILVNTIDKSPEILTKQLTL